MKINKSFISIAFSVLLGVGLLSFVLFKYPFGDVISSFSNVTPSLVFLYLFVSIMLMVVFSYRWKVLLKAQGYTGIPFLDLFSYRIIDYGVSYITPTAKIAGEPVRAAMITRNGMSFKEALTTVTIDKTIELSLTIILFVVGCFMLILTNALSFSISIFLIVLSALLIFLNWTFYYRILRGKPIFISLFRFMHLDKIKYLAKHQSVIIDFERPIIRFYVEKRGAYLKALGLSIFAFCLSMLEFFILLHMVGVAPSLKETFMVFSVVGMSFLIPVPMGLGSLEAMQAWLFSVLTFGSAAGVGLAMITRSRDMLWVLVAVILALYFGSLRRVLAEAFNSSYNNPIVKMTVFRGGKPDYLNIKMFRKISHKDFIPVSDVVKAQSFLKKKKGEPASEVRKIQDLIRK